MRKIVLATLLFLMVPAIYGQGDTGISKDSLSPVLMNSAEKLLATKGRLLMGGYGEVHVNRQMGKEMYYNGILDVHRLVLLFGYRFSKRWQFISEIEFEHVKEVFVEQAFLQYKASTFLNVRGGLMLVPMGIINEYHEPTAFLGVERPLADKYLVPTTWREIGMGVTGNIFPVSLRYQVYVMNGLNGYNGKRTLSGSGLRKGRQKGALASMGFLNFSGRVSYYGLRGLNIGLSGYFGKTSSTLFNKLNKQNLLDVARADSSVVGIMMWGADARYSRKGFQWRGQFYYTRLYNSLQYNFFNVDSEAPGDLGQAMAGFYIEMGYNIFRLMKNVKSIFIPFVRYSVIDTQQSVATGLVKDPGYRVRMVTTGINWKPVRGVVIKADVQFLKRGADKNTTVVNAGFGFMF